MKEYDMKPIVEIMDEALAKLSEIKDKNGESFLEKWEKVVWKAGANDNMQFEYGLVELIQQAKEEYAKKVELVIDQARLKNEVACEDRHYANVHNFEIGRVLDNLEKSIKVIRDSKE